MTQHEFAILAGWLVTLVGWWNSGAPTHAIRHHSLIPLLIRCHSLIIDNTLKITGTVLVGKMDISWKYSRPCTWNNE